MKKLTSIAICPIFLLCTIHLLAQSPISITSSNMPGQNDTIRYSTANPLSINVAITGANTTWNFDTLTATGQGLYEYKSAVLTPYAFYFLGLNKYGLKMTDSIGAGTFTFKEVYNFFKKTTADFQAEGIGFKYSGIPLAAYYTDPDEIYSFPLNFSDRDSSTFAFSLQLGTGISYTQKGYRINQVDGWGQIKTPYGTANCLRLVSTTYSKDSINYNGIGFSFPNNQRSYKWLSATEKIPMLEVSGSYTANNFVPGQARFRDKIKQFTGITVNTDNAISLPHPNPATGLVFLQSLQPIQAIEVLDLNGKLVYGEKFNSPQKTLNINLSHLSNGVYFLKMIDLQQAIYPMQKITICH